MTIAPPPPSTLSDRAAMLRTILEHPEADAPRLVYADWLDDIGDNYAAHTLRWFLDRPEYRQSVGIDSFVPSMTNYFGSGEVCGVWNRGFGCEIRLPCAAFMAHAASLFAAHPITAVRLVDKRPWLSRDNREHGFTWWRLEAWRNIVEDSDQSNLPGNLFELCGSLHPQSRLIWDGPLTNQHVAFPSESAALSALSDACVSYGRNLAGLRPLDRT